MFLVLNMLIKKEVGATLSVPSHQGSNHQLGEFFHPSLPIVFNVLGIRDNVYVKFGWKSLNSFGSLVYFSLVYYIIVEVCLKMMEYVF